MSSSALDEARTKVDAGGGTIGEQLVAAGQLTDDVLTDFYKQRLLVPQVNPNILARLPAKVVAMIPGEMAISLRTIPVALDGSNHLTVAMSDPSDDHSIDQIQGYTGAQVVRAVATQMQIAWCLAHYYGHVTDLGQRLLVPAPEPDDEAPTPAPEPAGQSSPADDDQETPRPQRVRGITGEVNAMRHRGLVPGELRVAVGEPPPGQRSGQGSGELVLEVDDDEAPTPAPEPPSAVPTPTTRAHTISGEIRVQRRAQSVKPPLPDDDSGPVVVVMEADTPPRGVKTPAPRRVRPAEPDPPELAARAGEVDLKSGRDQSIEAGPSIVIADDFDVPATPPRPPTAVPNAVAETPTQPLRDSAERNAVAPKPTMPGIVAQAAEPKRDTLVETSQADLLADVVATLAGDNDATSVKGHAVQPVSDEEISDATPRPFTEEPSAPILLDRRRAASDPPPVRAGTQREDIVVVRGPRKIGERHTSIGIGLVGAMVGAKRLSRDTAVEDLPGALEDEVTGQHLVDGDGSDDDGDDDDGDGADGADAHEDTAAHDDHTRVRVRAADNDPTRVELRAAPASDDTTSDLLAAPPSPVHDDDSGPVAEPPRPTPPRPLPAQRPAVAMASVSAADNDLAGRGGHPTLVMTSIDLDRAIPDRQSEVVPGHLAPASSASSASKPVAKPAKLPAVTVDDAPSVDDGWGPPGTTIPPPLLGAATGSDTGPHGRIPLPDLDNQPLHIAPPSLPSPEHNRPHTNTEVGVARMLEQATARVLDLIHDLGLAHDRDQVVATMIAHLAETHRRAGFFAARAGELALFAIFPRVTSMPAATLRLGPATTFAEVVSTRLPYRGPMHDPASRTFLQSVLGACPTEILLVPITVRDRVVGILFGEHRLRHTFDDQLALAGRAAGNALERILKAKRG